MSAIVKALNSVSKEVGAVRKEDFNQVQRFNFRGVDAVVNAVYPFFVKHGISYIPVVESAEYQQVPARNGGALTSVRLLVKAIFTHTSGESIEARVAAEAFDSGDKATAKAMSVAMRTALLQVLCLPTDEPDPDHFNYEQAQGIDQGTYQHVVDLSEELGLSAGKLSELVLWVSNNRTGNTAGLTQAEGEKLIEIFEKKKEEEA